MKEISGEDRTAKPERTALWYLVVLVGAGVFYVVSCAPTILWQDSALFVYRVWHNDIEGNLGLALAHPLYVMIGIVVKNIPIGQLAYRINLISAVFGALTAANLFLLVRLWLGKFLPALIAAITLAVSWTFWQQAVISETYTLYTALMLGELIVLLQYTKTKQITYLYLLGLLNGLALANHLWAVFGFGCYFVLLVFLLVRKQISLRHFGVVVLLWIIGALPYEYIVVKNMILSGDVRATLASALFGTLWQGSVLSSSVTIKMALENVIFILLNFPTPNLVLFFVGIRVFRKMTPSRSFGNIVLALLVLYFIFAFRYTVPDRYVFFVPFYCLAAALIGMGADVFLRRFKHNWLVFLVVIFSLLPIGVYFVTPEIGRAMYKGLGQRRQRPYRDEYTYFLQPWKSGYRGAERFAEEALDIVEKDAIIYADTTVAHALLYVQEVTGRRSDVKIVSYYDMSENAPVFNADTVGGIIRTSALYVVSPVKGYCPGFLIDGYDFSHVGVLWRVVEKEKIPLALD